GYESGDRFSENCTEYEVALRSQISTNVDDRVRYQHRENPAPTINRDRYRFEVFFSWLTRFAAQPPEFPSGGFLFLTVSGAHDRKCDRKTGNYAERNVSSAGGVGTCRKCS